MSFVEDTDQVVPATPEFAHYMKQIASGHCAKFSRGFTGCEFAERLLGRGDHWFLDLLALWRPAGEASGDDGLRLAVRDGYLNFYRCGQSVARVSVVRGDLRGEVHSKYFSQGARESGGQDYGRILGTSVNSRYDSEPYEGLATLRRWIDRIDTDYAGIEKRLVDDLVKENDNVIDLEMGLPAFLGRKSPVRMDLVTLEEGRVVFWEAKCAGDSRIRSRGPLPEVIEQLKSYSSFLQQDIHCLRIADAYRDAARVIVRLRALADRIGPARALGEAILSAADGAKLTVERHAALVVIDESALEPNASPGARWNSWHTNGHAAKLKGEIRVLAQTRPSRLVLGDAV